MYSIIGSFQKRGILDIDLFKVFLQPLFGGMNIPMTITMQEFYERTQIDLYFYTTRFKAFNTVEISHKTHPEWTVLEAVYASAALPIFLAPLEKPDDYYIDGGIFLNYPLGPCLKKEGVDSTNVLGVRKNMIFQDQLTNESTLFDYILGLLNKIFYWILIKYEKKEIDHEITIDSTPISIYDLYKMMIEKSVRTDFIEQGVQAGKQFCSEYLL
jgi:predicted acylesterase/phospholipase RssA